ncbi:unnamed protein product [Arabidopsis thaliana]|uniref:Transmembrane protein n=1 Tax=Arabidopsis thaliana TaxID=3702 RepID=A0A654FVK4_ARATH|nr:unnamed protein product [Arabidopsis thaliana]
MDPVRKRAMMDPAMGKRVMMDPAIMTMMITHLMTIHNRHATRLHYIGVKRSCERSVKRKWKFLKFINISQAKKLQLLAKAKGKEHQTFVEYTCLGKASRDFSQTYTSFLTWCFFGSLTCISFVWGLWNTSKTDRSLADLWLEINKKSVVIHEFKKEMSAKNALYMHRLDEITKVAKQNQEDLQKIVALLVSKK